MRLSAERRLTRTLLLALLAGLLVLVTQSQWHRLQAAVDPHHHEICLAGDLHQAGHHPLLYHFPTLAQSGLRQLVRADLPASWPLTREVTPRARSPPSLSQR